MVNGPGLYIDIGKKARDLLYKDFQTDPKFSLTTYTANGVAITSNGLKKGEIILADINTQIKHKNITTDIKVDTNSNVFATITYDEAVPGLKTIFRYTVPDQRSGKLEMQYLHDYAGICGSIGLTPNPIVNFSGVFGTSAVSVGVDVSLDSTTNTLGKYNAGLSYSHSDLVAALTLNDKFDNLTASFHRVAYPETNTAVGAEMTHNFSSNDNTFTIGVQHTLDPFTVVKGRVNNYGKVSTLIQHEWRPKSTLTLSGEVDTRAIEKPTKLGLALALKL
ncbi:mitochondrial outer membrane protein porin of 36 kDa-like [Aristolochia californica]|uniref:mitochondrial outer membrane protein porin of 36 kDa-like n=1 Tax=Aristolochia californica TaxID=171875 RepID=UPI0035D7706C